MPGERRRRDAAGAARMVVVTALLDPRWTVEMEAEALLRS